jgi:methyl-accepting chemotaxis protein
MRFNLPSNFEPRLRLYALDESACAGLRRLWPSIEPALAQGIDAFIAAEKQMPSVAPMFQAHGELIRRIEQQHFSLLLTGQFDERYIESCRSLSEQEYKIGITPRTRMIAGNMVFRAAADALARSARLSPRRVAAGAKLISQAIGFDIATSMTLHQDAAINASEARRQVLDSAIAAFELTINEVVAGVKEVSQALSVGSGAMRRAADEISGRLKSAAHASITTTESVETTAAATEELSKSIGEIGNQSAGSLDLANHAARDAEVSMQTLGQLADAVGQIGSVVDLISKIAGQTNLLALNATIEAARAGDAGRGFAVVASEVKALANQTEKATNAISRQITAVQNATSQSVEQIGAVAKAVTHMASVASAIATSVVQQSAAANQISEAVQAAASNTKRATEDVQAVEHSTSDSLAVVRDIFTLTERLSSAAADLDGRVGEFFSRVRAA